MTTVKEVARVTPCNTGRLAEVLCDVTLDDGITHRVHIERDGRGDWQLDRRYPDLDLQATLLSAAGGLADAIEAQQSSPMFASGRQTVETVVKEVWRYTPTGKRLKAIGCDVTCNGTSFEVSATRDKFGWSLKCSYIDSPLHDDMLRAVIRCASGIDRELAQLRRQLSKRQSLI